MAEKSMNDDRDPKNRLGSEGSIDDDQERRRRVLVAFFEDGGGAEEALSNLVALDFPLDRLSVLGRASSSGDDPLGIYYSDAGERMRGWGGLGAFWGGIWGLLTGAAGLFLLPGLGPVVAAGPVVQALAGATAGAALGGTIMVGAGAAAQLSVAIHRMGIPDTCIDEMHERLERGEHMVMLILHEDEIYRWRPKIEDTEPNAFWDLPYTGLAEGVRQLL
jgi:hypothetical protein